MTCDETAIGVEYNRVLRRRAGRSALDTASRDTPIWSAVACRRFSAGGLPPSPTQGCSVRETGGSAAGASSLTKSGGKPPHSKADLPVVARGTLERCQRVYHDG